MKRFYITSITVSGDGVKESKIEFNKGVNIIHGPSDTGKSYVMNCIDFMFASKGAPFSRSDTAGYDTVTMHLENEDGEKVIAKRKIVDGKNGDTGSSKVIISTTLTNFPDKEYKVSDYQELLLYLFGISERKNIIANATYKQNKLTVREFFYLIFLDEERIFQKDSVFLYPKIGRSILDIMLLLFFINGKEYSELIPTESTEEKNKKAIQKRGVISYLRSKVKDLTARHKELKEKLDELGDVDIEAKIANIVDEILKIENEIAVATEESHKYLTEIYSISAKLQEAQILNGRYKALHSQYSSDIKRLAFIADGDKKIGTISRLSKCPFCNGDIHNQTNENGSFTEATAIELERVTVQLQDLQEVEDDVASEITLLEIQLQELSEKREKILKRIEELKPKVNALKSTKESYQEAMVLQQNLFALEFFSKELDDDVAAKELESEDKNDTFSTQKAKNLFDGNLWKKLSDTFAEIVKACEYPDCQTSHIDIVSMDAIINGKYKKSHGKGYRAFINTTLLFSFMKFLEENGVYATHFLFLDSPILSLMERKNELADDEKISLGMKQALFQYLINHCGENQIIIAENEIPSEVDYSNANLIEFTKDKNEGRYGFFLTYTE